jgi:uncharacterized membrane protein
MMSVAERWSQPVERRHAALLTAAAVLLFAVSWGIVHRGPYGGFELVDTPTYQRYGEAIVDGRVPYRDFPVEYPPAALAVFVLPALGAETRSSAAYRERFEWVLLTCGAAAIAFMAAVLSALGAGGQRVAAALGFAALTPLALGSVVLTRFDLWPAALAVAALAALVNERHRLGLGLLGLAFAAKLWPGVLAPLALAHVWRSRGRREALAAAAVFAAVTVVCFGPFVALSPGGVADSLELQVRRPLQIETLGAAILILAHNLFGLGVEVENEAGAQSLTGTVPDIVAAVQTGLVAAALLALWLWFARRRAASRDQLVAASAAAVCAFVALGKVLSPQFLLWLVPLVALVRGSRGLVASAGLAVALVLTQLWFPDRYWTYALGLDAGLAWLVLARDLVLVCVLAVLVTAPRGPPHSA